MGAQSKVVVQAVAITATISVIVVGIVLYVVYRLRSARRVKKLESSFRRETPTDAPRVEFRARGAALKGVIVDEEGLDVLYLRKHDGGNISGCFSKVWCNPMMEDVKRMNCREEKPSVSEPIQQIPLLHHPSINRYETPEMMKKPLPPSPPPTPLNRAPPPPPPPPLPSKPPPPLPSKPPPRPPTRPAPPPPPPPKLRPAPPPQPVKRLIPSPKPPIAPRFQDKRVSRDEDWDMERMQENGVQTTKLKPLHWDKVTANAEHSMVWNEINDGSFRFDDELMEALFGYTSDHHHQSKKSSNPGRGRGSSSSTAAAPPSQIFILDPRKSQNTAIILKSLAISRREILDSVMEGRGLNAETLEKLTKICPTQEETARILQFNGNPTKLADAESFLYHILKAVPSAFVRFNAMLFRANYDPEILHLKESLQTCELGCKELRSGGIFFKLLEAILKAGNRMNAGTNRGNALGFNLTTLRRLSDVKSTNGKTTLLHFVVEQVVRSEGRRCLIGKNATTSASEREIERESLLLGLPALESLNTEFSNVKKAAAIDYDGLISACSVLTARVDEIKRLLSRSNGGEAGRFAEEMKGFLEDCEDELNVVREEERRVMELVRKTTVYYQTAGVKGGNPLQLFVIVKDFLNNVDRVCLEITKKLQKMTKVGTSGGSSPPLSPSPRSPVRFQNLQNYFKAQRHGASSSDSDDDF